MDTIYQQKVCHINTKDENGRKKKEKSWNFMKRLFLNTEPPAQRRKTIF
jgi:hypothetical protein